MDARRHIDAQAHVVGIEDSILIGELLLLLKEKESVFGCYCIAINANFNGIL